MKTIPLHQVRETFSNRRAALLQLANDCEADGLSDAADEIRGHVDQMIDQERNWLVEQSHNWIERN